MQQPNANMQMPMPQTTMQQTPQPVGLNGKIVDSIDIVRATEVPVGGYGIFPKADLSEIFIKSWNNNGTTSILTYQPVIQATTDSVPDNADTISQILQKINLLENKLDSIIETKADAAKKEGTINGF